MVPAEEVKLWIFPAGDAKSLEKHWEFRKFSADFAFSRSAFVATVLRYCPSPPQAFDVVSLPSSNALGVNKQKKTNRLRLLAAFISGF